MSREKIRREEFFLLYSDGYGAFGVLLKGYCITTGGLLYLQSYRTDLAVRLAGVMPLTLLVVEYIPSSEQGQIKQLLDAHVLKPLSCSNALLPRAIFVADLLNLILRDRCDIQLYQFLLRQHEVLNQAPEDAHSFFLKSLLDLSEVLGFRPNGCYSVHTPFFSLKSGRFEEKPLRKLDGSDSFLSGVLSTLLDGKALPRLLTEVEFQRLLRGLLYYLCYHLELPLKKREWSKLYANITSVCAF